MILYEFFTICKDIAGAVLSHITSNNIKTSVKAPMATIFIWVLPLNKRINDYVPYF
jgi:hypothetical protein